MNNLELRWLIPTALQVISLAIGLGVLGFVYEVAVREGKSFIGTLDEGTWSRWLALAGLIFAIGLCLSQASWGYKLVAIALAGLLVVMAWTTPRRVSSYVNKFAEGHKTKVSAGRWLIGIVVGAILLLVLGWGIHLGWHTIHLVGLAKNLQSNTNQVQTDDILSIIEPAAGDVRAIRQDLSPLVPIFNALQGLPGLGEYLGQIEPLLIYGDGLAQAGKEVTIGLGLLLEDSQMNKAEDTFLEHASKVMEAGQAHFVSAAQAFDQADQVRSRIRPELLPESIRTQYSKLDENFDLLMAGVKALQSVPRLLGTGEAQNYLILAQNRDELRATGGFISGIGLVTVEDGKVREFTLGDSYQIDDFSKGYPAPPEPLKRFMLADYWVTRDANWSPDFPTSAEQAQSLYTLSTGNQTQGVIAFNQLAVEKVLEAVGPVQLPGTDEPVTSENVEDYMRQAWASAPEEGISQEWWLHRKDFMQLLGTVILEQVLKSGSQEQLLSLGETIIDLLEGGQLLVYFDEPDAQAALEAGGWDGSVDPGRSDYLYLVDSNVGFNKADSVVQRSLAYQVDLSDLNHPTGNLHVTYQHNGIGNRDCNQEISYGSGTYQDMQQRCYLDYWRIYTPDGSELITSTVQPVSADGLLSGIGWPGQPESIPGEAETQIFAGLLMLPLENTSLTDITYSLPPNVIKPIGEYLQEYNLRIQVQPGLEGLPLQLSVKLPDLANPVSLGEDWKPIDSQTLIWEGVLDKSTELNLSFQMIAQP